MSQSPKYIVVFRYTVETCCVEVEWSD